jgi:putative ABC transport system permease protein
MIDWAQALQTQIPTALSGIPHAKAYADPTILYLLQQYQTRILVLQIPIALILAQVLGLVVFFLILMADLLVESQATPIALLRSRGANRKIIFGALSVQGIGLGLLAMAAGPFVAIALVEVVAQRALPPADVGALDLLLDDPLRTAMGVAWFALGAAFIATCAVVLAVRRAASLNILTLRRLATRASHDSAWKKLNLDIIGLVIAVAGYISYTALIPQVNPQVRVEISPLSFFAAIILLGAVALLFLRALPALLRLAAWVAARSATAGPMVALTHLARAPRQAGRIALLLGLATAFLIFASIFDASQAQRPQDEAAYDVGADFRGTLPHAVDGELPSAAAAPYGLLPGVSAATAGYTVTIDPRDDAANIEVALQAVDADTFATAAIWASQDPSDTLPSLMAALSTKRAQVTGEVPTIIDAAFAGAFHVREGDHFTLTVPGYTSGGMQFVVATEVRHIPGVYDNAEESGYGSFGGVGGALVDYASYAAAYTADHPSMASAPPAPNTIWLRTSDDATLLAAIRGALSQGGLALSPLLDRREEITAAQDDPLRIDLVGVLRIGAAAVLLLALIGSLVASWVGARAT